MQQLITELADNPYFFGDRDENVRRHPAEFIALPPRQRLEPDHTLALERHHRLIVSNNRFGGDGGSQLILYGNAAFNMGIHVGLEKADAGTALRLGAIQRPVGAPDE